MSWTTYGKNAVCSYEINHSPYILFVDDYSHYLIYLQVKKEDGNVINFVKKKFFREYDEYIS